MERLREFLEGSPIAKRIRLPAAVVMKRVRMTAAELLAVKDRRAYGPERVDTRTCELEIGGQTAALGRIVYRRGKAYFKVEQALFEEEIGAGGVE